METKQTKKPVAQWKVIQGLHISDVERALEDAVNGGWTVHSILGPLGNVVLVLQRELVLR